MTKNVITFNWPFKDKIKLSIHYIEDEIFFIVAFERFDDFFTLRICLDNP